MTIAQIQDLLDNDKRLRARIDGLEKDKRDLWEMIHLKTGIAEQLGDTNVTLTSRVEELEQDRKELRRVICTLQPALQENECECSDEGLCDKHLVEVTLANYPKHQCPSP